MAMENEEKSSVQTVGVSLRNRVPSVHTVAQCIIPVRRRST